MTSKKKIIRKSPNYILLISGVLITLLPHVLIAFSSVCRGNVFHSFFDALYLGPLNALYLLELVVMIGIGPFLLAYFALRFSTNFYVKATLFAGTFFVIGAPSLLYWTFTAFIKCWLWLY